MVIALKGNVPDCLRIAASMLNKKVEELDDELVDRILKVREYIHMVKSYGELNSSQVIAVIIDNYIREKEKKNNG